MPNCADLPTLTLLIPVKCLVKGYGTEGCVGGVIGKLTGNKNGKLYSVISNVNGEVISSGGSVGGAIGYVYYSDCDSANGFSVENVSVKLTGLVKGDGVPPKEGSCHRSGHCDLPRWRLFTSCLREGGYGLGTVLQCTGYSCHCPKIPYATRGL